MKLLISKEQALDAGMTHEGTLFGVPCWMAGENSDEIMACAKFAPFELWLGVCSWVFDAFTIFVPEDKWLVTPMKFGAEIKQ